MSVSEIHPSHEAYIEGVRAKAGALAEDMLRGTVPYLEGAVRLLGLLREAELQDNDADLRAFALVASEIDHLPIGPVRKHWSEDALKRLDADIERATLWAREATVHECESVKERFGAR